MATPGTRAPEESRLFLYWLMRDVVKLKTFKLADDDRKAVLDQIIPAPAPAVAERLIQSLEGAINFLGHQENEWVKVD